MFPSPSQTPDQKPCQAGSAQYESVAKQQFPHSMLQEMQGQEPRDLIQQVALTVGL